MGGPAPRDEGMSESNPYGELMLLSGTANPELSERIAREMGMRLAEMELTRFADGEFDVKIGESVRGHDVFLLQPTCHPVSENLIQLFIILDALRRASASRITAVIPYYGYQRKEKKTQPRDPISAKLMANIIELAGANRVICVDLHAEAIQGFFDIPVDALTATKILARRVRERHGHDVVIVSPDTGGALRARRMARILDAPIAIIDKRRPRDDAVEVINVIGDVAGLKAVIVDDLISTGSTLAGAALALRDKGATGVDVVTTHGVFTEGSLQRLHEAPIDEICVTDTIPFPNVQRAFDDAPKLRILSVAPLIAEAIVRVHEGRSVSELFR
jgi:ribose-phosphate pyrophosphokinase